MKTRGGEKSGLLLDAADAVVATPTFCRRRGRERTHRRVRRSRARGGGGGGYFAIAIPGRFWRSPVRHGSGRDRYGVTIRGNCDVGVINRLPLGERYIEAAHNRAIVAARCGIIIGG